MRAVVVLEDAVGKGQTCALGVNMVDPPKGIFTFERAGSLFSYPRPSLEDEASSEK